MEDEELDAESSAGCSFHPSQEEVLDYESVQSDFAHDDGQPEEEYECDFEDNQQEPAAPVKAPVVGVLVDNDTQSIDRSRAASSTGASGTHCATEDMNKRYIAMLNSGRLASKKKAEMSSEMSSLRSTGGRREPLDSQSRSVHEAELLRLKSSASMEVAPVSRTFRPPSELTIRTSQSLEKNKSPQRMGSTQFRVAMLAVSAPTTPSTRKILTPGPGAYDAAAERSSTAGPFKYSFGTSRQRPVQVCLPDSGCLGPVYNPQKEASSTMSNPARIAFSRQDVGSRFSLSANIASNAPQWNPGPGNYVARIVSTGGKIEPGAEAPKVVFGKSQKLLSPERSLSASVFISEGHAKRENLSLHSPGVGTYNPNDDITHHSSSRFTLAAKAPSFIDGYLDPSKQPSPGPIYQQSNLDNRGARTWGDDPKATFGRSRKEPEVSLSSSTFISKEHAMHSNLSLHSPGPVYFPDVPQVHTRVPHLASGPTDRFFNRLEPGRVA